MPLGTGSSLSGSTSAALPSPHALVAAVLKKREISAF